MTSGNRCFIVLLFLIQSGCVWALDDLAYYSDYFSFIGRDANGFVAFALDNNRGVDGNEYQAEHFGVLYDGKSGWRKLAGMGNYENTNGDLERIPDSPGFAFEGQPLDGMVIASEPNGLSLQIAPITTRLTEQEENRTRNLGVADAALRWKGRTVRGRVISEHLVWHGWNRLTRTYADTWDNFQGFYLALGSDGENPWQDLYLRSEGEGDARRTKGFMAAGQWSRPIHAKQFAAFDKVLGWGLYRWPRRWEIEIAPDDAGTTPGGRLTLRQVSRRNVSTWLIGGFAMTVVEGEIDLEGRKIPVLGFVELIK